MKMHHVGDGQFKRCVAKSDDACDYGPGKFAESFHGSSMDEALSWYEAQREGDTFATSQSTDSEEAVELSQLARHNLNVRRRVAENPSTPDDALRLPAEDKDLNVRRGVAENPSTPAGVLAVLAGDEDWLVRQGVAGHPNAPAGVLAVLAGDSDYYVRRGVAGNLNTPAETLRLLAGDENWRVRYRVAYNPSTPADALRLLAGDKDLDVRHAVSANPELTSPIDFDSNRDRQGFLGELWRDLRNNFL